MGKKSRKKRSRRRWSRSGKKRRNSVGRRVMATRNGMTLVRRFDRKFDRKFDRIFDRKFDRK